MCTTDEDAKDTCVAAKEEEAEAACVTDDKTEAAADADEEAEAAAAAARRICHGLSTNNVRRADICALDKANLSLVVAAPLCFYDRNT